MHQKYRKADKENGNPYNFTAWRELLTTVWSTAFQTILQNRNGIGLYILF